MTDRIKLEAGTSKIDLELNEINLDIAIRVLESEKQKQDNTKTTTQTRTDSPLENAKQADEIVEELLNKYAQPPEKNKKLKSRWNKARAGNQEIEQEIHELIKPKNEFTLKELKEKASKNTGHSHAKTMEVIRRMRRDKAFTALGFQETGAKRTLKFVRQTHTKPESSEPGTDCKLPEKRFECPECGDQFRYWGSLQNHAKIEHGSTILDEDKNEYLI